MKKLLIALSVLFIFIGLVQARTLSTSRDIEPTDVTTRNFVAKMENLKFDSIRKICTYDFCDYIRGTNIYTSLDIFTNNYLKTIDDNELKANLRVKGIKITKIILKEE